MAEGQAPPDGVTVRALLAACGDDIVGSSDTALISLDYDAGLRVAGLIAAIVADGSRRLKIARPKADQEGEGALAWSSPETMQRLSA